ncbi:MAG: hypothetical protein ACREXR_20050, partial [Gammaproteobacteria bacterium]
ESMVLKRGRVNGRRGRAGTCGGVASISFSTAKTDRSPMFLTYADARSGPRDAIGTPHRSLIQALLPARTNDSARARALRPLRALCVMRELRAPPIL